MAPDRVRRSALGRRRKVLLDSSFLIAVMERPTPWARELTEKIGGFEAVVIRPVYDELDRLAEGEGRASRYASLAKSLVDRGDLKLQEANGTGRADDELISLALDGGESLVATLDEELAERLRAVHIGVVSLRQGRVSV